MNERQNAADAFAQNIDKHVAALRGRFARECRSLEARHHRGLPGQPEAAQRAAALGDMLVNVYGAPEETKQRGLLLLATDCRLAGMGGYALSLLAHMSTASPELEAQFRQEIFLCQGATGEGAEEAWNALESRASSASLPLLTARIEQLLAEGRMAEALELVEAAKPERLVDAERQPEEVAARALQALARLALCDRNLSAAHHCFTKALQMSAEIDVVHCLTSRDFVMQLHREHIAAVAAGPDAEGHAVMESHRGFIALLRQILERDESPELKAGFAAALGSFALSLEQLGYFNQAIELREAQLRALEETVGNHNPCAAAARERLAALLLALGRGKEGAEELRLARCIYEDFGERTKAEKVRKALAEVAKRKQNW